MQEWKQFVLIHTSLPSFEARKYLKVKKSWLQGVPVFLEEGDYKEIETFNIIEYPKSIKVVKEDMGTPELFLASSTNYEGK